MAKLRVTRLGAAPLPSLPFVRRSSSALQPHFDFKHIKLQSELIKTNIRQRKCRGDVDAAIRLHAQHAELQRVVEALRRDRNATAQDSATTLEDKQAAGKRIKEELVSLEQRLAACKAELTSAAVLLPCDTHPDAPVGPEAAARTILEVGRKPTFAFPVKDHVALGKSLGLFDQEAAASVTGSAFAMLTGAGALLELALVQWAMNAATGAGFTPVLPPDLAHVGLVEGCGFNPRDGEAGSSQVYRLADSDLCLIGTAEIPLAGLHAGQLLHSADLPKAYAAFTHCFRREAGGAGTTTRGLYRLHQFSKVELFGFLAPCVDVAEDSPFHSSRVAHPQLLDALVHKGDGTAVPRPCPTSPVPSTDAALAALVSFQVSLLSALGLHARVLDMPTEELGASAYRKVDCEVWMPGRRGAGGAVAGTVPAGSYGEVTSASNCMAYQSQRLNVRARVGGEGGGTAFVHTLNATCLAVPRIMLALLETHQQADGSVVLPDCLLPYMGGRRVLTPATSQQHRR